MRFTFAFIAALAAALAQSGCGSAAALAACAIFTAESGFAAAARLQRSLGHER